MGLTRREFARASLALAGSALVPKSLSATEPITEGLFDVHLHLSQAWYGPEHGPISARQLLAWMDAHGVAQAAILPLVSPEAFWYPVTTEYVLEETAAHRDRLSPFCAVDPRTLASHLPEKKDVVDLLKRYQDAGAVGFGEHKPNLPIDDPLNMRLYEACSDVGLPLLFHLDNLANIDEPGLPGLARALAAFPTLMFIGHGKGWWASVSGGLTKADLHVGYPRGPVIPGGAIDELMDRYPNIYGDLSSSGAHAMTRDPAFGREFLRRRADRLMFGTDYYDLTQREFPQFSLFDELKIDAEIRRKIGGANARRLLG